MSAQATPRVDAALKAAWSIQTLVDLARELETALAAKSAELEKAREQTIEAVNAEPECPGQMPDAMWEAIRNDRDAIEEMARIVVRTTKKGIIERIAALAEATTKQQGKPQTIKAESSRTEALERALADVVDAWDADNDKRFCEVAIPAARQLLAERPTGGKP